MIADYTRFIQAKAIDLSVYIGQWPYRYSNRSDRDNLAGMSERLGLSYVAVSHIASIFGHDTWTGNRALFLELGGDPRFLPFVVLNPAEAGWEGELEWSLKAGARGIRLLPGYHGYELRHPAVKELVAAAREAKLPIALCARLQDERLQHPRYQVGFVPPHQVAELIDVASGHPLLVSGYRVPEYAETARYLPDNRMPDHVWFDLWHVNGPLAAIASIVADGRAERFVYGSCHPVQTPEATALQLAAADISEESRALLCRDNALRFLDIAQER